MGGLTPKKVIQKSCVSDVYQVYFDSSKYFELQAFYWRLIFLFLNQNICCGYSKEPSQ